MRLRFPATLLVFLAVLWVKAIYPASSGIADTDFFWHLTYGQWILEHGALPAGDTFSWTFAGQPYQLTQWLGEVVMGAAYNQAGLEGTKVLSVGLCAITIGFAWLGARRYVHTSVALGLALLCNLVQVVSPMRPQLFSFALLAIAVYLVVSYLHTQRIRFLLPFPVLLAVWVNLHGGFVMGLALYALMALGLCIESVLARRLRTDLPRLALLAAIGLTAVAATLLNPYGYRAITTVLMIGGLRSSSVISEWMPVNLTTELGWFYLLNLVPFLALIQITGVRPRPPHALIATFFLIFGVLANRQVALCAAVMAPLTAAVLARSEHYRALLPQLANPHKPVLFSLAALLLGATYPSIAAIGNKSWSDTLNLRYPIHATDFLVNNGLSHRVLSDTLEASYLIHRGVPVFIDGRMDLYRDHFFFTWYLASRATPGWENVLLDHQPAALLLRHDMAIRQAALATGRWKQVFEDARYSVLVPASSPLPEVLPAKLTYLDPDGRMLRPYMP